MSERSTSELRPAPFSRITAPNYTNSPYNVTERMYQ